MSPELAVELPFVAAREGSTDAVVSVTGASVRGAMLAFADGTRAPPTYLDREAGVLVWIGPSRPVAVALAS